MVFKRVHAYVGVTSRTEIKTGDLLGGRDDGEHSLGVRKNSQRVRLDGRNDERTDYVQGAANEDIRRFPRTYQRLHATR